MRPARTRLGATRIRLAAVAAALVAATLGPGLAPRTARAQSAADQAEAQIRQGTELRHQNQDARALPFFERAYELARNPRTAAQLGLVKMALGYCVEAERLLGEALAVPDHPWIARNRDTLERTRANARQNIGEVAVTGIPAGAEVLVNGHSIGTLPLASPVRLDKGPAEIHVRAPGHLAITRTLVITAGAHENLSVALGPTPSPSTSPSSSPSSLPAAALASSAPPPPLAAAPAAPRLRPLAITAGGLAAAGLAFGIVETVIASHRIDDFNGHTAPTLDDPAQRAPDCETSQLNDPCRTIRDAHDRARTLAIVGYVGAGVLAATSAALFVSAQRHAGEPSLTGGDRGAGERAGPDRVWLACAPVLPGTGLTCSLQF